MSPWLHSFMHNKTHKIIGYGEQFQIGAAAVTVYLCQCLTWTAFFSC